MKYLKNLILMALIFQSCSPSGFRSLSKKIYSKEKGPNKVTGATSHDIRMELYGMHKEKLQPVVEADTIWLLNEYVVERLGVLGKIWSRRGIVCYEASHGKINLIPDPFTKYTSALIEKWDSTGVREQEKLYSTTSHGEIIRAVRVVKEQRTYKIDTLAFKRFFNLERDRNN